MISCITLAKRSQEQKEEETVVSKSRPAVMNISSYLMPPSSCAASSPIASKSQGKSAASVRLGSKMNLEASSVASTPQVRLKGEYLGELMEQQRGDLPHQKKRNFSRN